MQSPENNAEWEKQFSLQIDDGELDGLTLQEAFVLGYELADIKARMHANKNSFHPMVHIDNFQRIKDYSEGFGFEVRCVAHGDEGEIWGMVQWSRQDAIA